MKRKGNFVRRMLFKLLPFEYYLLMLSKLYFLSFNLGLLKNNRLYQYPYFLEKIIEPGAVCLDIGANLGYYSVLLSKLVGGNGKVLAVEPIQPILAVLRRNTKGLKNVEIYPFALGTEDKKIVLGNDTLYEKGFIATGSNYVMDSQNRDSKTVSFEAEMKKGSDLFKNLSHLDFIKCDIEGYETVVIPELKSLIIEHQPMVLIEATGENRKEMLNFFRELDYQSFELEEGKLKPANADAFWDVLFIPKDKMGKVEAHITA